MRIPSSLLHRFTVKGSLQVFNCATQRINPQKGIVIGQDQEGQWHAVITDTNKSNHEFGKWISSSELSADEFLTLLALELSGIEVN